MIRSVFILSIILLGVFGPVFVPLVIACALLAAFLPDESGSGISAARRDDDDDPFFDNQTAADLAKCWKQNRLPGERKIDITTGVQYESSDLGRPVTHTYHYMFNDED